MIVIQVKRWGDGMEITANGHADYGERGNDIVCAGVSALLYGYVAYLQGVTSEHGAGQVRTEEQEGYLWVRSKGMMACDARAFAVIEAGLELIAETYPRHVRIIHSEKKEEEKYGQRTDHG